jgi:hypothetical protein
VEISRVGTAPFPVVIQLETAGGQRLRLRADWQRKTDRLLFRTSAKFKTVTIDPDIRHPDLEPANANWPPQPEPGEKNPKPIGS